MRQQCLISNLLGYSQMISKTAIDFARRARNRGRVAAWTLRAEIVRRRARRETPADDAPDCRRLPFPAFDMRGFNPIGWRRESGRDADAAYHPDPVSRAARIARLAAMGENVHVADCDSRLKALLGDELHEIISADPRGMDGFAREIRAVRGSRAAMRHHSRWARERMRGDAEFPLVSVLLATKRPDFLAWALENVARQTYPRIETVLAMHGDGFGDTERIPSGFPHPVKTLRIASSQTLGAALAAATAAASGALIAKMDDDDCYAPDHLWDLVLARAYSDADLAAKGMEFVYLAEMDKTVYLSRGGGERYWTHALAGGTMLITRRGLERAGGWRDIPSGVDTALLADALRSGARVYRASGIGYVHVRHGARHTWDDGESAPAAFLARADSARDGLRLDIAAVPPMAAAYPAGASEG